MSELLETVWNLLAGVLTALWDLLSVAAVFVGDFLYHLHVSAPRLEGLLVGVLLCWLLVKRDKHPLLKVLSSPLKLVLDILDLLWDQLAEVLKDAWEVVKRWVQGGLGLLRRGVSAVWGRCVSTLRGLRDRLKKSD